LLDIKHCSSEYCISNAIGIYLVTNQSDLINNDLLSASYGLTNWTIDCNWLIIILDNFRNWLIIFVDNGCNWLIIIVDNVRNWLIIIVENGRNWLLIIAPYNVRNYLTIILDNICNWLIN